MIGFINIYKPKEISSAFAVNKFKWKVKTKCGHMGTLDPLASGVLPIGLNQATRLFNFLLDKEKVYEAVFDFSYETPSYDLETQPIKKAIYIPSQNEIEGILPKYIGNISQIPPAFSAKMVDGKRSYKLARKGAVVDLPPKNVEILDIKLLEQVTESAFKFKIVCKGGTDIRSLARDLGSEFSCPATMISLERTACGVFKKENSVDINEFLKADDISKFIIKPENVLSYKELRLDKTLALKLLNGVFDTKYDVPNGLYKVFNEEEFWGVGEVLDGVLKMKAYVRENNKNSY